MRHQTLPCALSTDPGKLHFLSVNKQRPFMAVTLPDEASARLLGSRTVLLKAVYEHWADALEYSEVHSQLQQRPDLFVRLLPIKAVRIQLF
jgi:hypothetical protein